MRGLGEWVVVGGGVSDGDTCALFRLRFDAAVCVPGGSGSFRHLLAIHNHGLRADRLYTEDPTGNKGPIRRAM
jgi:hypothetical protein